MAQTLIATMDDAKPLKRCATYEDLLGIPDHKVAEIIDGELYVFSRPSPRYANSAHRLGGLIAPFGLGFSGPGRWWLLPEPELHFSGDALVPDYAGWREERLDGIPEEAFIALAPDWVCEVLSPSTERIDREKKLRIYARECVRYTWLIDPVARRLEILRLEAGEWTKVAAHAGDGVIAPEPFDALPFSLTLLWQTKASR